MGAQGIVSSLCPIDVKEESPGDPLYGYRPAMASIISRLATQLQGQCFTEKLTVKDGAVECQMLASLPQAGQTCDPTKGMSAVDPQTLARTSQALVGQAIAPRFDPTQYTVCQIDQSVERAGQRLVRRVDGGRVVLRRGAATGGQCPQALLFSPSGQPAAGVVTLTTCLESIAGSPTTRAQARPSNASASSAAVGLSPGSRARHRSSSAAVAAGSDGTSVAKEGGAGATARPRNVGMFS